MDRTIPRHPNRRGRALTSGIFVDYGDRIVLRDRWGNTWARESVSIVQGGFGYADDGAQKLPRPYVYDARGVVVIEGDAVLINFIDGDPKLPVVLGGVRSAKETGFLARGYQDEQAPYNRAAFRLRALDAAGAVLGEARVDIHGAAGEGTMRLLATDSLELVVGEDLDSEAGAVRITVSDGQVVISAGGTTEPVILGTTFLGDLKAWLDAFTTLVSACGSATTALQIAGAFATFAPSHGVFVGKVGTSVSSGAAPHLSTVTKTQ